MSLNVNAMRDKDVKPPSITGAPEFERAFRAHRNTLPSCPPNCPPRLTAKFIPN
jgi:hypothetical protein